MKRGIALKNIATGMPDFIGSKEAATYSEGEKAKLIKVWKCKKCGYSIGI